MAVVVSFQSQFCQLRSQSSASTAGHQNTHISWFSFLNVTPSDPRFIGQFSRCVSLRRNKRGHELLMNLQSHNWNGSTWRVPGLQESNVEHLQSLMCPWPWSALCEQHAHWGRWRSRPTSRCWQRPWECEWVKMFQGPNTSMPTLVKSSSVLSRSEGRSATFAWLSYLEACYLWHTCAAVLWCTSWLQWSKCHLSV